LTGRVGTWAVRSSWPRLRHSPAGQAGSRGQDTWLQNTKTCPAAAPGLASD
jgi:hypothetical protein